MAAVVGVLNESLTESIKGFYKLRKAYITLDGILAAEADYMRRRDGLGEKGAVKNSVDSLPSDRSARPMKGAHGGILDKKLSPDSSRPPSAYSIDTLNLHPHVTQSNGLEKIYSGIASGGDDQDDDDQFYDAEENQEQHWTDTYTGHLEINGITKSLNVTDLNHGQALEQSTDLPPPKAMLVRHGLLDHDPDSDVFSNPIDVFIHSGANLCFGLLLVMISMIPPAFNKLLFIIGFHGDKERGVRMLWQASKFHNINGAFAGLIVLGFYNTLIGFADIVPEDSDPNTQDFNPIEGYPKQRCEALLADMRSRHPKSHLWLLEEARMNAFNKDLSTALALLSTSSKSPLKQVEALEMFEKALDSMYAHQYSLCAESFIACVSLNNWSHALYYYIAGSAHLELYRLHQHSDPTAAKKHAAKAAELLKLAPQHAGKKKFMARQLPFDVLVSRKIKKWEARSQELECALVDAVGVSPVEEMIFFWNGYKRMDPSQLEESLERLAWSDTSGAGKEGGKEEGSDEKAILAVLRAATLRNLGRYDEAENLLKEKVLGVERSELKGGSRDDWTAPAAHYEMGVLCWMRRDGSGRRHWSAGPAAAGGAGSAEKTEEQWVKECGTWIDKAAKWEAYELDARIGLKIATAQDTLKRWWGKRKGGNRS